jgi:hypothetical protein
MMWELFLSTGNLDAYLTYRACVDPEELEREQEELQALLSTNDS